MKLHFSLHTHTKRHPVFVVSLQSTDKQNSYGETIETLGDTTFLPFTPIQKDIPPMRFHFKPLAKYNRYGETVHDCEASHPVVRFHHIAQRNSGIVLRMKGERKGERTVVLKPSMDIELIILI